MAIAVAVVTGLAAVTYPIHDPDIWQHLLVGKVILQTHSIPSTQLWTWPTHGAPDVLPSWLFAVLIWPVWEWAGVHGLFAWRWITTLVAFGLAGLAARRMGATGAAPLVMLVWCALLGRERSHVRPETLAGILLAAEIFLLESRRNAAPSATWWRDRAFGIVPLALVWANAHISYYFGFVVSGAYLMDDLIRSRRALPQGPSRQPAPLGLAILIAGLVSLANPSGWRTLVQPLEYFTVWRHEAIYQTIGELAPIPWDRHVWDGLPVWLALVVLGAIWRWRARGFDIVQAVLLLVCLPQALTTQRFLATAVLALAPFAARDAGDWLSRRRWPSALQSPARRVALAAPASVLLIVPTLSQPLVGFGYGFNTTLYPERAADWMQQHDVRGRSFNVFWFGGYLLYRFYPDPGRLPFFDIHQAGTRDDRFLGSWALQDLAAWKKLDGRYRFDWVMLPASLAGEPDLNDFLDADTTWALVFADDAAVLWLRRDGSCAGQAAAQGYRRMPAGTVALAALGQAAARDAGVMREAEEEFARAIRSSPHNGRAHTLQGHVEMFKRNFDAARANYDEAVRLQPGDPDIRPWQGLARLRSGDPQAALESFRARRRMKPEWPEADVREAQALAALGRRDEAIRRLRRSLERHPELSEARDSLKSWGVGD